MNSQEIVCIHVHMCVCMCVCAYVSMYTCVHVRLCLCMNIHLLYRVQKTCLSLSLHTGLHCASVPGFNVTSR